MSRVRLGLALLSLVAGCGPLAAGSPGSSPVGTYTSPVVDPSPVHTSSGVEATGNDNFAALDEVPVAGGELRLVEPRRTRDDSGAIVTAIMFPLRHTDVQTKVSGMSAMYTVTQTFENPYDEPIDAVYVFPLGDETAITSYAIVIGERTIAGEIKKKEEARATYEEARAQGHTAALLEQEKRTIFRQRIANIAPRETIKVRMQYIELLGYRDGQYEIAFPLVVGPRYLPAGAVGSTPVGAHHAGRQGRPGVTSIPYADASIAGSTVSFTADVAGSSTSVTALFHDMRPLFPLSTWSTMFAEVCTTTLVLRLVLENRKNLSWSIPSPMQPRPSGDSTANDGCETSRPSPFARPKNELGATSLVNALSTSTWTLAPRAWAASKASRKVTDAKM